ncbi:MAG: 16S rRNA (guanine(527)-N(7))-methyltransferase RsmG [Actinomycetota bacterium]
MKHPPGSRPTEDSSTLVEYATELGIDLDGDQVEALLSFEILLIDRAIPLGLVARGDRPTVRERHILDSLRGVLALEPADTDALDLGSGAGLPGIVVAIARPSLRVGLVEVRRRRAAFLELAVERLGLPNVAVLARPAGQLDRVVDVCFARALAGLSKTWEIARRLLRPDGRLVYFGGEGFREADQMPPDASSLRLLRTPALASSGPVVIMTRQ